MSERVFVSVPVLQVIELYEGLVDERAWGRAVEEQLELLVGRLIEGHRARVPGMNTLRRFNTSFRHS